MKITDKKRREIECIKWFIPNLSRNKYRLTKNNIIRYFEHVEQGKHEKESKCTTRNGLPKGWNGFYALLQGKRWRGIHAHEIYEPAICDGMGYVSFITNDMPRIVVDFLKKEMFKGKDAEVIETVYQDSIKGNNPYNNYSL